MPCMADSIHDRTTPTARPLLSRASERQSRVMRAIETLSVKQAGFVPIEQYRYACELSTLTDFSLEILVLRGLRKHV